MCVCAQGGVVLSQRHSVAKRLHVVCRCAGVGRASHHVPPRLPSTEPPFPFFFLLAAAELSRSSRIEILTAYESA